MRFVSIFIGAGCILALGFVLGTTFAKVTKQVDPVPGYYGDVLDVLTKMPNANIPPKAMSCELSEGDGDNMSVGDFITSYLNWSLQQTGNVSFSCDGSEVKQCSWSFGRDADVEGWNRFLKFEYNVRMKSIDQNSLSCVDVP